MSAGPHFKQAAAEIRNAILALRRDIDEKRKYIILREQEMRRQKDELTRRKNTKGAAVGINNLDPHERVEIIRSASQDSDRIAQVEREFHQERERLLQDIGRAEQDITGLEGQARYFESRQNQ